MSDLTQARRTWMYLTRLQMSAGGLFIAVALLAGAIGLQNTGSLRFPAIGSTSESSRVRFVAHSSAWQGEGWLDVAVASSSQISMLPIIRFHVGEAGQGFLESGIDWRWIAPLAYPAPWQGDGLLDPAGQGLSESAGRPVTAGLNESMGEGRIDSQN